MSAKLEGVVGYVLNGIKELTTDVCTLNKDSMGSGPVFELVEKKGCDVSDLFVDNLQCLIDE